MLWLERLPGARFGRTAPLSRHQVALGCHHWSAPAATLVVACSWPDPGSGPWRSQRPLHIQERMLHFRPDRRFALLPQRLLASWLQLPPPAGPRHHSTPNSRFSTRLSDTPSPHTRISPPCQPVRVTSCTFAGVVHYELLLTASAPMCTWPLIPLLRLTPHCSPARFFVDDGAS